MVPITEGPSSTNPPSWRPTRNLQTRTRLILSRLERAKPPVYDGEEKIASGERNDRLFKAACMFAEIIGEGRLRPSVATHLLLEACKANGLFREDPETCRKTIASAFRKVEEGKLEE